MHIATLLAAEGPLVAPPAISSSKARQGSVLLDDLEIARLPAGAAGLGLGCGVEEVISKVARLQLVDSPDVCACNEALFIAVLRTKHLPVLAADGDTQARKESLSLAVFKVKKQQQQQQSGSSEDLSTAGGQGSSKSVANGSTGSSILVKCISLVRLTDLVGPGATAVTDAPELAIVHTPKSPPLLLITYNRVVSAHPILNTRSTVFRIDANSLHMPTAISARARSTREASGGVPEEEETAAVFRALYKQVNRVIVVVSLAQLLIVTANIDASTLSTSTSSGSSSGSVIATTRAMLTDSLLHAVPIYSPLGAGALLDLTEGRLLLHHMSSNPNRRASRGASSPGGKGAPPAAESSEGRFDVLPLPRRLLAELLQAHQPASQQPGHSGRQQQCGLVVASTLHPRRPAAANSSVFSSLAGGFAGGYTAAVAAGADSPPLPGSGEPLSLWLYSRQSRRWRSTYMTIDATSPVVALSSASTAATGGAFPACVASLLLDEASGESIAARRSINGSLAAATALAWFAEHSLLLVSRRRSRFCLEALSRAVTKSSLARGTPAPAVHKVVLLPPGLNPRFVESTEVALQPQGGLGRAHVIAMGDGINFVAFCISAVLNKQADVVDYKIYKVFESELPVARGFHAEGAAFCHPLLKMTLLLLPDGGGGGGVFRVALLLLDSSGQVFTLQDTAACNLLDAGPVDDISSLTRESIFATGGAGCHHVSSVVALQAKTSPKSRMLLVKSVAAHGGIIDSFLSLPLHSPQPASAAFGLAAGSRLFLRPPPPVALYTCSGLHFKVARRSTDDFCSNLVVVSSCVLFNIFIEMLRATAPVLPELAAETMDSLYASLGSSARATLAFSHCCELELKRLAETMTRHGAGSTKKFYALTRALHGVDQRILVELISRLSRKLDPSSCRKLFPVLPPTEADSAYARSALSLFDGCLRRSSSLVPASRLLTVACEHSYVSGSTSSLEDGAALEMALQLLLRALHSCSFALSLQCVHFCMRLEAMLGVAAGEVSRGGTGLPAAPAPRAASAINGLLAAWEWAVSSAVEIVAPMPARSSKKSKFIDASAAVSCERSEKYQVTKLLARAEAGSSRVMSLLALAVEDMIEGGRHAAAGATIMSVFSSQNTVTLLHAYFEHTWRIDDGSSLDDSRAMITCIMSCFGIGAVPVGTHLSRKLSQPLPYCRLRNMCQPNPNPNPLALSSDKSFQFDVPETMLLSMLDERGSSSTNRLLISLAIALLVTRRHITVCSLCFYCLGLPEFGHVLLMLKTQPGGGSGGLLITPIVRSLLSANDSSTSGAAAVDDDAGLPEVIESLYKSNHTVDFNEIDALWSEPSRHTAHEAALATLDYLSRQLR